MERVELEYLLEYPAGESAEAGPEDPGGFPQQEAKEREPDQGEDGER